MSYDQSLLPYISQETLAGGYVCYNGDAFYVVNTQVSVQSGVNPIYSCTGLPGGTHSHLIGQISGSVILEDIVQSSYDTYPIGVNRIRSTRFVLLGPTFPILVYSI